MLGNLLHEKPDELRADMQQVYGLCLDEWTSSPIHYAVLARQLPPSSRICGGVGTETALLNAIEYNTRVLCWQKTKDAQHGRKKPKPIELSPSKKRDRYTEGTVSMTVDEFEETRRSMKDA